MFKDLVKGSVRLLRDLRSRCAYNNRIKNVPSIDLSSEKNVLVITIDCLRNDRISRTGYKRSTTPFLDSLASFTSAIAPAPWTFSSVPSILTGLYPHNHGAIYPDDSSRNQDFNNPPHGVDDQVYTLAELLSVNGYETRFDTAIGTAAIPLDGRFKTTKRRHDVDASTLLSEMKDWWNSTSESKFSYVHLGDLHEPLHEPKKAPFGDIPDIEGINRWRFEQGDIEIPEFDQYRSARVLLYDTIVRHVDSQIERTLHELEEIGETIVIVTSDHGEEFWEYNEFEEKHFDDPRGISGVGHGHALVPPVVDVPIITNLETVTSGENRRSLVDIVPTVLRELDSSVQLPTDGMPLQIREREEPVLSQEIAYGPNQISVTDQDDHLIYIPVKDTTLLIDFVSGEEIKDREREKALKSYLPQEKESGSQIELSQDIQEQLADLGYAE